MTEGPSDPASAPELGRELLVRLGLTVRAFLRENPAPSDAGARTAEEAPGDTSYGLDRSVEGVVHAELARWPDSMLPFLAVCEGLDREGTRRYGPSSGALRYRVLIDPIDGTRLLMHDKRAAWLLAALAPDAGAQTRLSGAVAAAIVELPTSKQGLADDYSTTRSGALHANRRSLETGETRTIEVSPSRATTLEHGFGQVASFHPGGKVLAADLMERISLHAGGRAPPGRIATFEDQYLSTGGQMVELMVGHDRFTCDLRPLLAQVGSGVLAPAVRMSCHPYDIAGLLVARQSGVILTDGFGRDLDAPFDVKTPVHWCGYANRALRTLIEPVIQTWLTEQGVTPRG